MEVHLHSHYMHWWCVQGQPHIYFIFFWTGELLPTDISQYHSDTDFLNIQVFGQNHDQCFSVHVQFLCCLSNSQPLITPYISYFFIFQLVPAVVGWVFVICTQTETSIIHHNVCSITTILTNTEPVTHWNKTNNPDGTKLVNYVVMRSNIHQFITSVTCCTKHHHHCFYTLHKLSIMPYGNPFICMSK